MEHEQIQAKRLDDLALSEIKNWDYVINKYKKEYQDFEIFCHFCAAKMNLDNVNKKCDLNKDRHPCDGVNYYTEEVVNRNFYGNHRHWFGKPNKSLFSKEIL